MIVFAKSIDDFKNYFNSVLLVEHYPQAFFINLFIDEKMKNEIIPVNSVMMTDKPKFEITIDYDNADAQLSAFLNDINACDLLFTKDKDVTSGLKIRIRNEEMKTMNFNDAFKREKFDVSKTDAEGLGKKLTQFIKNRKAKYYVQRGFNMGDIADAYVAGCNNMWDLMMSKIADSVKAYKSDIGNETLTVNQAAEIFEFLMNSKKTPANDENKTDSETLKKIVEETKDLLKSLESMFLKNTDVKEIPGYTFGDLMRAINKYPEIYNQYVHFDNVTDKIDLDGIVNLCHSIFTYGKDAE